jgi:hypothetical protein
MSITYFNTKENVQILWDVIYEEEIFKFLSYDIQNNIYSIFINNIPRFFETEKMNVKTLVELNKKYIILILDYIKKNYSYQASKIVIHNEPINKELITYEEIQNDKKNKLEKDFSKRQEEFEDSMTLKAPPLPEFSNKDKDEPIKEMDKILKEIQAQRNYEVEEINRSYNNFNQLDNWLKPQETSVKQETIPKKNVTFNKDNEIRLFHESESINAEEHDDIFSKLKKVKKIEDIQGDRIANLEINMNNLNEKMDQILALLSHNK